MGAWGTGIWDNDDAGDWAGDLRDSDDPTAFAMQAFAAISLAMREDAYVDADVAGAAIAAAAWLASGVGGPPLDEVLDMPPAGPVTATQATAALAAVSLATGTSSEWRELWDEAGTTDEARAPVDEVVRALRVVTGA
ncbi:DUF4259 domain-containing protein [Nocardioides rubriscoriae]|uniref:DUF4259 domain-containing protein n=1 Tax=Nocardioides rubriscoriae TaxID=642762 RepID=UPI0011DF708A|nr:DUF4259 domain-containing protein [Nocardioides rubriscoriae]